MSNASITAAFPVATQASAGHSTLETASWIFSIIGGSAGLITLVTVVIAIGPIWENLRKIEAAQRETDLGGWRDLVKRRAGLLRGIPVPHTSAIVPAVSLTHLVGKKVKLCPASLGAQDPKLVVQSGWANFLSTLGLSPDRFSHEPLTDQLEGFYTEKTTGLIQRRLAMRWSGSEFACICAMLGCRCESSSDGEPDRSPSTALEFPALWKSPVGEITLRTSNDGLLATFRPRLIQNHILPDLLGDSTEPVSLKLLNRAYLAAHSLPMGDGALFLEEPPVFESDAERDGVAYMWKVIEDGIYSFFEANLLQFWGLDCKSIVFLGTTKEHTRSHSHDDCFKLACYLVKPEVQHLIRSALVALYPDGYALTSSSYLISQLRGIFDHWWGASRKLRDFYRTVEVSLAAPEPGRAQRLRQEKDLKLALQAVAHISDKYHDIEELSGSWPSHRDYQVISVLDQKMRAICEAGETAADGDALRWAMICCPRLVRALLDSFQYPKDGRQDHHFSDVLETVAKIDADKFSCERIGTRKFDICSPGIQSAEYTGTQVVAALCSFVLTGMWISLSFENNVCFDALRMPEDVFMI